MRLQPKLLFAAALVLALAASPVIALGIGGGAHLPPDRSRVRGSDISRLPEVITCTAAGVAKKPTNSL
jgi:hypothetical protein